MSTISRRRALSGAATAGLGLPLIAACGDDGAAAGGSDPSTTATSSSGSRSSTAPSTKSPASSAPAGGIPTSEVPVGGGIVLTDEQVVLTQPTEGDYRAFTSICTHAGCPVARVTAEIECDCHGSRFSIEDGSVVGGPAPSPLEAVDLSVDGDRVVIR